MWEKNRKQEKETRKIRFRTLFEFEMFTVVSPRRQCSKFFHSFVESIKFDSISVNNILDTIHKTPAGCIYCQMWETHGSLIEFQYQEKVCLFSAEMAKPCRLSLFYWFPIHYSIPLYAVEIEDFNYCFQSVHSKYISGVSGFNINKHPHSFLVTKLIYFPAIFRIARNFHLWKESLG